MDPTITDTHIEYSLYAMPAPPVGLETPNYDASPMTHCGLLTYGFPLLVDGDGKAKWIRGTINTNASGTDPGADEVVAILKIISNFKPSSYVYPEGKRVNKYTPMSKGDEKRYNINVVAREVRNDVEGQDAIVGYSSYRSILVELSGSMPISPGGLFGWEVALIVIAILVVLAIIVVIAIICVRKKRQSMGYGNLDGHGNTSKHGLNVELPDDDLSISASTPSSRSLTTGGGGAAVEAVNDADEAEGVDN
eukprot:gnl/Chilomastix_caulleri/743.p1 GENE.gnl/Chilomastix_caulleri/743~~gnl/Chilomastix_caulleri/743.p1  ORF type:complete len:250 (+),score=100.80 gnl/Chilomastix_caulleri/743:185-934(+)